MNQDTNPNDLLSADDHEVHKMPSGLNVLTIFSFIGCAIQFISAVWNFFNSEKSYKNLDKLVERMNSDNMPGWAKSLMGDPANVVQMITKSYENRIPICLLGLTAVTLCFVGVLQMRKLKKQGFIIYTIGELLPFLSQILFIGAFSFSGIVIYIFAGIALLFILLYASYRKALVY